MVLVAFFVVAGDRLKTLELVSLFTSAADAVLLSYHGINKAYPGTMYYTTEQRAFRLVVVLNALGRPNTGS